MLGRAAVVCPASMCNTPPPSLSYSPALPAAPPVCSIQVNCLLPGAINTPFLDSVINSKAKMDYVLHRIPAGLLFCLQCVCVG